MQKHGTFRLFLSLLVLFFAASSTSHASSVVVVAPNANAATNGSTVQFGVFSEVAPTTFQTDIAASQLTSLIGDTITSIGYRMQVNGASVAGPVTISGFSLELSGSANAIGSLSANQAANLGANAEVVDSGTLVLSGLVGGPGPNPFFLINFATPYLYSGGDLLVTDSYSTSNANFYVDAVPPRKSHRHVGDDWGFIARRVLLRAGDGVRGDHPDDLADSGAGQPGAAGHGRCQPGGPVAEALRIEAGGPQHIAALKC